MEVVYYDPSNPGSFGGIASLARQTRSSEVRKWLSTQDTYTLHKPVRRIFPRRKTFAKGIDDLFQADLADMQNLSRYNDGYRFILTCRRLSGTLFYIEFFQFFRFLYICVPLTSLDLPTWFGKEKNRFNNKKMTLKGFYFRIRSVVRCSI
jgi:hypothetical protein